MRFVIRASDFVRVSASGIRHSIAPPSGFCFAPTCFPRHHAGMGKRREARERAVQFLFQHDLNPPEQLEEALDQFWVSQQAAVLAEEKGPATWGQPSAPVPMSSEDIQIREFAEPLIRGVIEHRIELDEQITQHAKNWDLHRIGAVDRNILRLAIYEMLHRDAIPPGVS